MTGKLITSVFPKCHTVACLLKPFSSKLIFTFTVTKSLPGTVNKMISMNLQTQIHAYQSNHNQHSDVNESSFYSGMQSSQPINAGSIHYPHYALVST